MQSVFIILACLCIAVCLYSAVVCLWLSRLSRQLDVLAVQVAASAAGSEPFTPRRERVYYLDESEQRDIPADTTEAQ